MYFFKNVAVLVNIRCCSVIYTSRFQCCEKPHSIIDLASYRTYVLHGSQLKEITATHVTVSYSERILTRGDIVNIMVTVTIYLFIYVQDFDVNICLFRRKNDTCSMSGSYFLVEAPFFANVSVWFFDDVLIFRLLTTVDRGYSNERSSVENDCLIVLYV